MSAVNYPIMVFDGMPTGHLFQFVEFEYTAGTIYAVDRSDSTNYQSVADPIVGRGEKVRSIAAAVIHTGHH